MRDRATTFSEEALEVHPDGSSTMVNKGGGTSSSIGKRSISITSSSGVGGSPPLSARARRKREEAVRRLVAEVQQSVSYDAAAETQDWLVANTVAAALEKGLDRDLHAELVQEAKDNAGRIGQICHDHADVFLASVAQVAALGEPSAELADGLKRAHEELNANTAGPMYAAAVAWEEAKDAFARAQSIAVLISACRKVAVQIERARKQAAIGRPKAALEAVEQAKRALATPLDTLLEQASISNTTAAMEVFKTDSKKPETLEQTPFGKRATSMLPKIENEVLMGARRSLNRWFLSLRSGGDAALAGRAALRKCSWHVAVGPGGLGLGGTLPPSYIWRAKTADNLLSRVHQGGRVARAVRQGYWFERDARIEADRLDTIIEGVERKADAIASAFGWYRCWEVNSTLFVDPSEYSMEFDGNASLRSSTSRHGLGGSRHGLRGSRHGKRSLGFRASSTARSHTFQDISTSTTKSSTQSASNKWSELLNPSILTEMTSSRKEEDEKLLSLPESVHPVRRAEMAFTLLGKYDEFVQYYEQNRFGETTIGSESKDDRGDRKSTLSALTGDDVSIGTDRIFFAKTLPHLCAAVLGFSAVEAALELGNFVDDQDATKKNSVVNGSKGIVGSLSASRFREASELYERNLVTELGSLVRSKAGRANFGELVRASHLLAAFRAALKVVHPSSSTRRFDKDLIALDKDILVTALKIAQDEQLRATTAIVIDDSKVPMQVADARTKGTLSKKSTAGVPDPEEIGLPFGLSQMKQNPTNGEQFDSDARSSNYYRGNVDDSFTFSPCVPVVVRSLHARAITCAAFALSQQEFGMTFPDKKGNVSAAAGFVLDCVEECINVAAVGLKDSDHVVEEGSVEKAIQVMANISALQHSLPRFFGTIMRGMCHIGLIRADEIEPTMAYAEKALKGADKGCDAQVGSTYSLIYEICRNKIDSHINYALENFQWVAKSERDMPNAYCEGLIGYLKSVFASLGPMDEGSRAGLHFSCCGHVSERLVKLLSGKPGDTTTFDDSGIPPVTRIDAFGIKNLLVDCEEFERFADSTGVPQLRDCFNELRILCSFMLDKDLPVLVLPENAASRRRKYPILSLDKVGNILEKYVGTGLGDKLMGGTGRKTNMLFIDKKEVQQLIKIIRSQG